MKSFEVFNKNLNDKNLKLEGFNVLKGNSISIINNSDYAYCYYNKKLYMDSDTIRLEFEMEKPDGVIKMFRNEDYGIPITTSMFVDFKNKIIGINKAEEDVTKYKDKSHIYIYIYIYMRKPCCGGRFRPQISFGM